VERVLRNTAATITVTFYNGSTAVDADSDPTVVAKKADGTTLFSTTATNEAPVGTYSVVIPAQATLNVITLTWTGLFTGTPVVITSTVEIVGGFYFSIAELRAYDKALQDTNRFPTTALVDARMQVEAEFEDICGRAFVPRYYKETGVSREDVDMLWLDMPEPITILKYTVDGADQIGWYNSGLIKRDKYAPRALVLTGEALASMYATNIDMEYEYGLKNVPTPIKYKALKRARQVLIGQNSTIDERALTMSLPEIGTVNLATPGVRGSETGVPDIDVVLSRYKLGSGAGVY
jgi:hypothetical protein